MQENKYPIKDWAKDDRPREKLLVKGAETLSDSELLAILLNKGTPNKSAVELAREVLKLGHDNLNELARVSIPDLMKIKGIGEAKAITLAASLELGRRRRGSLEKTIVTTSSDIAGYLQEALQDHQREVFGVIYMNRANKVIRFEIVSEGGITGTVADPRVILKLALGLNAVNIILCHNHPSGSLKPSHADVELTAKIRQAANYLDIRVIDHIIVSECGYFSFADEGML